MTASMWDLGRSGTRSTSRNGVNTSTTTGYSYSIKGGPAPSRPPREFVDSQFETAPPVREPPPRNPKRNLVRNPNLHPAPLYTQKSSVAPDFSRSTNSRAGHRGPDTMDISPPSSPEPSYTHKTAGHSEGWKTKRDVSPGDEDKRALTQLPRSVSRSGRETPDGQQSRTNIPMMRRARRKMSDAALRETHSRERLAANQAPGQQQQQQQQQKGEVRWDAMTGEPTTSAAGRPAQVKPAEYAQGLGISSGSSPPQQKSPTAMMTAFGDRVRRMGRGEKKPEKVEAEIDPAANAFSSARPGWRGASGRQTLVEPVRDNLAVAPLRIPAKSNKRVVSPTAVPSPTTNSQMLGRAARGQSPPVSPPGAETATGSQSRETIRKIVPSSQVAATPAESKHQPQGPSYPSPPLSSPFDRGDAPSVAAKQLQSSITGGLNISNAGVQSNDKSNNSQQYNQPQSAIHRKPPPAHANHHAHQESVSSVYSQYSQQAPPQPPAHGANPTTTLAPTDPWVQPSSRFSITTYATSAANTPRESFDDFDHSDAPPVPTPPQHYRASPQVQQQSDSVMDRRRPLPPPNPSSPIVISLRDQFMTSPYGNTPPSAAAQQRKAAAYPGAYPSAAPTFIRSSTADRPDSMASSINKTLPPAPPESSAEGARDRVAMINAQLSGLGNRRINITRSIKQMTELMPTDSIMDSAEVVCKRDAEKRKVEALRMELAEVQREEYELGLKLHRAYKRMDRDAEWEPTTLWVRRVTG